MSAAALAARFLGVREEQLGRAGRLVLMVLTVSLALVVAKAAQSGVFLSAYTRADIPWAFAGSAALLATLSALSVAGAGKLGPARLAQLTLALSAIALVLLALLLAVHAKVFAFIAYCIIESIAGLLLIQVWSVVSAAVDPRSAKRILPIAGVGASVAWTAGGLVIPLVVHSISSRGLLALAGVLVGVALALMGLVVRLDLRERRDARRGAGLLEGWRRGIQLVIDVPLVRLAMLLSVVALLTEQLMDFQLMTVARERAEGHSEKIAAFFGHYYGITSALGTALLLGLSGRVLARLGAPRALALTPIADTLTAAVAAIFPSFPTFVVLRGTDRVLKSAIWTTATEQVQTPLGAMQRSQSRALVRGVLGPIAYGALAVGLAALPEGLELRWVAVATGAGSLLLAAVIVLRVRRAYVRALQRAIDDRKLVLDDPEHAEPALLGREACLALRAELESGDEERAVLAAELLAEANGPDVKSALERALDHALAPVRALAIEGLARMSAAGPAIARRASDDPDPEVRLEALRALRRLGRGKSADALARAERDEDPRVRALARIVRAEHEDPSGSAPPALVAELLRGGDRAAIVLALGSLRARGAKDPRVATELKALLAHSDVELRVATMRTIARLRVRALLPHVLPLFDDPRTAPLVLARLSDWGERALDDAWAAAGDEDAPPSTFAAPASVLSEGPLSRLLTHPNPAVRAGTAAALGDLVRAGRRRPLPRSIVQPLIERDIAFAYGLAAIASALERSSVIGEPRAFLANEIALEERALRERLLLLLGLLGSRRLARSLEMAVRRAERSGHVAELLELTFPEELARRIVPLFEAASASERARAGVDLGLVTEKDLAGAVLAYADPHIMGCAMITIAPLLLERNRDAHDAEVKLIPIFERMRFLRRVPLFEELSGDDLRLIANIVEPASFARGETIFEKGDPGEDLFVISKGKVAIRDGQIQLAELGELDFFGELAVLDREPRSAGAVCVSDVELMRLRAADFSELMLRRPPIQQHVLVALVRRIREMSRRLSLAP